MWVKSYGICLSLTGLFDMNKNLSVFSCITLCQMAVAKIACCAPESWLCRIGLPILTRRSCSQDHKPQTWVQLGGGEEFAGLIDTATWEIARIILPLRNMSYCYQVKHIMRPPLPWISYPLERSPVPPMKSLLVDLPNSPADRLTHPWTSAMDKTWARAKTSAADCIHLYQFFCLK